MKNVLIIGASGYIGFKFYNFCQQQGYNVIGTCHSSKCDDNFIKYDMEYDDIASFDKFIGKDKYALICAGESKISICKDNQDKVYRINVVATKKAIQQLSDLGYHIIYCSSDNVYDGIKGNYKETDLINPINEYGKMKAQVEKYILCNCPTACIIRLSKVVGIANSDFDMLKEWKDAALKKKDIYCIKDNYFNPIFIDDVVSCIMQIMRKKLFGVYNVCGNQKYSRFELCKHFLNVIGLQTNIYEKQLEKFGFNDKRPLDTSMSNQKITVYLENELKIHDLEECFSLYKNV